MPFVPENISISKSTEFFANLTYMNRKTNTKQSLTFELKDCYSHFGPKMNDDKKSYSIGISLEDQRKVKRFKKIETRCNEISSIEKPKGKRLLKSLYEKDQYTTLYLKLKKDQAEKIKPGKTCLLNGRITFSAIYLGDKEKGYGPSIIIRVADDVTLKPIKKRGRTNNDPAISDSSDDEDGPAISDSDEE